MEIKVNDKDYILFELPNGSQCRFCVSENVINIVSFNSSIVVFPADSNYITLRLDLDEHTEIAKETPPVKRVTRNKSTTASTPEESPTPIS